MKTIIETILILTVLVLGSGCAGSRNLANNSLDGPRWASTYKQLKSDYAAAESAAGRNDALDGFENLAAKSPSKASKDLVKKTLCPLALSEGRTDILEGVLAPVQKCTVFAGIGCTV